MVRSAWLDDVRSTLWAQDRFSFIPNRVLEPPHGTADAAGGGPRVAFCGFPSDYSLAFLLELLRLDVRLVAIITSPGAHPAILGENALSQLADHLGVPLLRAWRVNDEHTRIDLASLTLDAVVMASFDQIVGARALALPRHGWLNVHPSLLPRYRGPEPVYWAIADGATETGVTLHVAVPKFDAGPVMAQRRVEIGQGDDAGTLTRRLCAAGGVAIDEALGRLLRGEPGTPLDLSTATYRPSVGHRRLEDATSALEAERMVRAGWPNMPAYADDGDHPVYVARAAVVPDCDDGDLRFADGCLRLLEPLPRCGCHHDEVDCPHREA